MEQLATATVATDGLIRYRSHKTVWALAIDHIESIDGHIRLHFQDDTVQPVEVPPDVIHRLIPVKGDYYVVYADGYQSVSPKKAFEEGYRKLEPYEK